MERGKGGVGMKKRVVYGWMIVKLRPPKLAARNKSIPQRKPL